MKAKSHIELGQLGEKLAVKYLQRQGYDIVALNFTTPTGESSAEIDIIVYDRKTTSHQLVFVEVKTRSDDSFAPPEAAVDLQKQRKIIRAAKAYRKMLQIESDPYRYDVIGIVMHQNEQPKITLFKNAFVEDGFKKNSM